MTYSHHKGCMFSVLHRLQHRCPADTTSTSSSSVWSINVLISDLRPHTQYISSVANLCNLFHCTCICCFSRALKRFSEVVREHFYDIYRRLFDSMQVLMQHFHNSSISAERTVKEKQFAFNLQIKMEIQSHSWKVTEVRDGFGRRGDGPREEQRKPPAVLEHPPKTRSYNFWFKCKYFTSAQWSTPEDEGSSTQRWDEPECLRQQHRRLNVVM